jgi:hypothetical protein
LSDCDRPCAEYEDFSNIGALRHVCFGFRCISGGRRAALHRGFAPLFVARTRLNYT